MKVISKIFLFSIMLLLITSCNSFLDIKPYGRTIPKTAEEFSALLHNHLNNIDNGSDNLLVGNAPQSVVWDVESGDDFETSLTDQTGGGRTLKIYVGDVTRNSNSYYSNLYAIIRDCNIVLGELEDSDDPEVTTVRGAAHAMRAVAYYQLLRLFTEVPQPGNFSNQLGLPLVTAFNMEEKPIRSNMQETINLIESDLKQALAYQVKEPVYRFTDDVNKGYLARLYFWTKQWDKALPIAQELLEKYPLLSGDSYKNMMTTMYDLTGNQLIKSYRAISPGSSSALVGVNAAIKYRPVSKRFISTFSEEERERDIRYSIWVNDRRESIKIFFCGMRSAEFKLIEAESLYHLGRYEQALQSINELRSNRIIGYEFLNSEDLPKKLSTEIINEDALGNNITPLLALILRERRKELFLEGDRFFEQKRNGSPSYWTAYNGRKYTTESYMYTFPIPYRDIEVVGPGLIQNEGYVDLEN